MVTRSVSPQSQDEGPGLRLPLGDVLFLLNDAFSKLIKCLFLGLGPGMATKGGASRL